MPKKKEYDEQLEIPGPWEWVIVIFFTLAIITYGLVAWFFVLEGDRHWDFGGLPDTPARSIYSTERPPTGGRNIRQIPKLPETGAEAPRKSEP